MTPSLGSLPINLPVLLETRMLVQANSGAGKSWTLRRVLEQTATGVQQLVIDPEGEFASLREKFDYIVCAPHDADAVATPQTAAALARALWEANTSAILDIYELKAHERVLFVRRFLEALINAPKKVWHPTLVAIDEVQMFAPQVGSAESLQAVIDLASRGRKRGLALVGATQRLSKLHKDVAAELLNKIIMRTGLDVDVARAADELGMPKAQATQILRELEPGEAFVFGPALTRGVERTRIGPVTTSHPKTGQRGMVAPPPPSKAVLAKLAKLEGLQRDAEQEVKTVEGLQREVTDLRRKLTIAEKAQTGVPEAEWKRRLAEAVETARADMQRAAPAFSKALLAGVEKIAAGLQQVQAELAGVTPEIVPRARTVARPPVQREASGAPAPRQREVIPAAGLSASQQRVLDALAWWEAAGVAAPSRHQVAFVAGYTVNGHFNNLCGDLRTRGLIDYPTGGALGLLEPGRAVAHRPDAQPTREDLVRRVLGVLKGEPMRRIFQALVDAGEPLPREELASRCGYTVNGHFNNLCGALNGIGVADYPSKGHVGLAGIFKGLR
jgi:hypothetical protein